MTRPHHFRFEQIDNDERLATIARLLPQLSLSAAPVSNDDFAHLLSTPSLVLIGAFGVEGTLVGMLSLVVFSIPTGTRALIEDVVVDEALRGSGIGGGLVEEALRIARDMNAKTVDLTSRPEREAANRLYKKLGFEERKTNVYRYVL